MQKQQRNVQKSVQSCCFAKNLNLMPFSRPYYRRRCRNLSPLISVIRMGLQRGRTTQKGIW